MTEDLKANTLELLGLAAVADPDPMAQAVALLTAATVIIEREVGTVLAAPALMALIEPTIAAWDAPTIGATQR